MAGSRSLAVAALAAALAACRAPFPQAGLGGRLVDLTHPLDASTVYWPTGRGFVLEKVSYGVTPGGFF
ncbi:MAG TPA: cyclase family protein, partial [Planctomycetota bacterium]|nr:cyclase family protein [Planctomycetota bacterium]